MIERIRITLCAVPTLILTGFMASVCAQEVAIPDPGLNAAVRETPQKPGGPLTQQDLLNLTVVNASSRNVSSISGLVSAWNLTTLTLPAGITALPWLVLNGKPSSQQLSPSGWAEPGQTPEFDGFTLVLKGALRVTYRGGGLDVAAGQAIIARAGEWVQDSTPHPDGAEYLAVCRPASSPETVHRDA